MMDFAFKMMNVVLKMMGFALKMKDFALKMMNFALQMKDFALKMMNFSRSGSIGLYLQNTHHIQSKTGPKWCGILTKNCGVSKIAGFSYLDSSSLYLLRTILVHNSIV